MTVEMALIAGGEAEVLAPIARAPIRSLLAALDGAGIRYCHWKSNIRLPESLAGQGDLDLLVDRRDAARLQAALLESGFRIAMSATGIGHPGVFHAFALDPDRADLIHVHAYFQIVTGDSLAKSYRLPFEETLLASTRRLHGVPVPAAELELMLFVLRIALKHTSLPEVLLVSRGYGTIQGELSWLRAAADPRAAEDAWSGWLPGVPVDLFRDLLEAIADRSAVGRRIVLGRRLARHLRGWRRLDPITAAASRWWRVTTLALGRVRRRRALVPVTSGIIVALVGPKATGKSTLSDAAARRLGKHLSVRRVHVGKPPPTALSIPFRALLPLARRLVPGERSQEYEAPERRRQRRYSLLHVLRMTALAYERRALLRRCWRQAAAGSIVIADRYPSASVGAIDSPRFDDAALVLCESRLKRWLMRRERALYDGLPRPTLVIRLSAPIETAIRRDAERIKDDGPNALAVGRRRAIETATDFPGSRVIEVDTEGPLDQTVRTVTDAIWRSI